MSSVEAQVEVLRLSDARRAIVFARDAGAVSPVVEWGSESELRIYRPGREGVARELVRVVAVSPRLFDSPN